MDHISNLPRELQSEAVAEAMMIQYTPLRASPIALNTRIFFPPATPSAAPSAGNLFARDDNLFQQARETLRPFYGATRELVALARHEFFRVNTFEIPQRSLESMALFTLGWGGPKLQAFQSIKPHLARICNLRLNLRKPLQVYQVSDAYQNARRIMDHLLIVLYLFPSLRSLTIAIYPNVHQQIVYRRDDVAQWVANEWTIRSIDRELTAYYDGILNNVPRVHPMPRHGQDNRLEVRVRSLNCIERVNHREMGRLCHIDNAGRAFWEQVNSSGMSLEEERQNLRWGAFKELRLHPDVHI